MLFENSGDKYEFSDSRIHSVSLANTVASVLTFNGTSTTYTCVLPNPDQPLISTLSRTRHYITTLVGSSYAELCVATIVECHEVVYDRALHVRVAGKNCGTYKHGTLLAYESTCTTQILSSCISMVLLDDFHTVPHGMALSEIANSEVMCRDRGRNVTNSSTIIFRNYQWQS